MSQISQRIKQRRNARGLTADDVAKYIGVSRATVYRWESGDTEKINIDVMCQLARVLDTTPAYLLGWSETEQQSRQRKLRKVFATLMELKGVDRYFPDDFIDRVMNSTLEYVDFAMYKEELRGRRDRNAVQQLPQGTDE